jgi:hypothetical protein
MAIIGQQKPKTWWNDSQIFWYHIRRSTWFTVLWDWFKTLSAKVAEFILLVAVLWAGAKLYNPELAKWSTFDSTMNTLQNLALDAAGIGLLLLVSQAEKEGRTDGVGFAKFVAWSLIVSMIVNMSLSGILSTFGQNEKSVAWLIVLLIIARAVFAVLYGVVLNKLENRDEIVGPEIVRTSDIWERVQGVQQVVEGMQSTLRRELHQELQQMVTPLVESVTSSLSPMVQKVVYQEVNRIVTPLVDELPGLVEQAVQGSVQPLLIEQPKNQSPIFEQVDMLVEQRVTQLFVDSPLVAQLEELVSTTQRTIHEMKREMNSTVTEFRAIAVSQRSSTPVLASGVPGSVLKSKKASLPPASTPPVQGSVVETSLVESTPAEGSGDEGFDVTVPRYIREQIALGNTPSLSKIVAMCRCSKKTAIKYRREVLGGEEIDTEEVSEE